MVSTSSGTLAPLRLAEQLGPRLARLGDLSRQGRSGRKLDLCLRNAAEPVLRRNLRRFDRFPFIPYRRKQAIRCLRILQATPSQDLLPLLLSAATLNDPEVSAIACEALGRGARLYEGATVPLVTLWRRSEGATRRTMCWALRQLLIAHPRNILLLAGDPGVPIRRLCVSVASFVLATLEPSSEEREQLVAVLERATHDTEMAVRSAAHASLAAMGRADFLPAALADPAEEVRRSALRSLPPSDDPRRILCLTEALRTASPGMVRVLGATLERTATLVPRELIECARGGQRAEQSGALDALAWIGQGSIAPQLLPLLEAPRASIRRRATLALAALARSAYPEQLDAIVIDRLVARLAVETEPQVLAATLEAVAFAGDGRCAEALMAQIPNAPTVLRQRIVEAIATLGRLRPETVETAVRSP